MAAIDQLKQQTDDQLQQQLGELKREQFNLRFQSATNQLEKPSRVREVRRTIAQIKTLLTQHENGTTGTTETAKAAPAKKTAAKKSAKKS